MLKQKNMGLLPTLLLNYNFYSEYENEVNCSNTQQIIRENLSSKNGHNHHNNDFTNCYYNCY